MEQANQQGQTQQNQQQFKRQIAHIMRIKDILESPYYQEEGWKPNYILYKDAKVSRVNLIGTIITEVMVQETEENKILSFDLDDGTGTINARQFTTTDVELSVTVGDIVLCVGKIREFNGQKYLSLELVKKLKNKDWIEFRKRELEYLVKPDIEDTTTSTNEEMQTEEQTETEDAEELSHTIGKQQILDFIRSNDEGEGVAVDYIAEQLKISDIDAEILELLKQGDVFELKPGHVKLL
jgi:RPA family protein